MQGGVRSDAVGPDCWVWGFDARFSIERRLRDWRDLVSGAERARLARAAHCRVGRLQRCLLDLVSAERWACRAAYVVPLGALALYFASIEPRNDRDWSPEMAQLMTYERQGDEITLHNVRNFDWTGPMAAHERWEERHYDLTK